MVGVTRRNKVKQTMTKKGKTKVKTTTRTTTTTSATPNDNDDDEVLRSTTNDEGERLPAFIPRTPQPSPSRRSRTNGRHQTILGGTTTTSSAASPSRGHRRRNGQTSDDDDVASPNTNNNTKFSSTTNDNASTIISPMKNEDHDDDESLSSPPRRRRVRLPFLSDVVNQQEETSPPPQTPHGGGGDDNAALPPSTPATTRVANIAAATTTTTPSTTWKQRLGLQRTMDEEADYLALSLHTSAEHLLDTLFRYLSQLPVVENINNNNGQQQQQQSQSLPSQQRQQQIVGGMTLPASALGWLSSQLSSQKTSNSEGWNTMAQMPRIQDRLRLLTFLLPRVTHLRIVRGGDWPPPCSGDEDDTRHHHQRGRGSFGNSRGGDVPSSSHPPQVEVDNTNMSVVSGLTFDDLYHHHNRSTNGTSTDGAAVVRPTGPTREAFLEYMNRLQNHPRIDLGLFENLQCIVLEGIPPTWIINSNDGIKATTPRTGGSRRLEEPTTPLSSSKSSSSSSSLQVFSVTKAAINRGRGDLHDILQPHYRTLTHIKLQGCEIGTFTRLESECRHWTNLVSLNLSHNQLIEMPARGLKELSNLQVLDLSYNLIKSMEYAHCCLGQLRVLKLSHNQIQSTTNGLDKLYSLEELYLDNNVLEELPFNLSKLPLLKRLDLQGNTNMFVAKHRLRRRRPDKFYRRKKRNKQNRILLLEAFQQVRHALLKEELPIVNGSETTSTEWKRIISNSYAIITTINNGDDDTDTIPRNIITTTTKIRRVKHKYRKSQKAVVIDDRNTGAGVASSSAAAASTTTAATANAVKVLSATNNADEGWEKNSSTIVVTDEKEVEAGPEEQKVPPLPVKDTTTEIDIGFTLQDVLTSLSTLPPKAPSSNKIERGILEEKKSDHNHDDGAGTSKDEEITNLAFSEFQMDADACFPAWLTEKTLPSAPSFGKVIQKEEESKTKSFQNDHLAKKKIAAVASREEKDASRSLTTEEETLSSNEKLVGAEMSVVQSAFNDNNTPLNDALRGKTLSASGSPARKDPFEGIVSLNTDTKSKNLFGGTASSSVNSDTNTGSKNPFDEAGSVDTSASKSASKVKPSIASLGSTSKQKSVKVPLKPATEKPKVATIKLNKGATAKKFNILDADWDDLIQTAADGMIPNGKIENPVAALEELAHKGLGIFPNEAVSLLPKGSAASVASGDNKSVLTPLADNNNNVASVAGIDESQPTELGSASANQHFGLTNALPENIYDDDSCISSLGTSDFPRLNKFQLAEDNAFYDGPESCQNMNVLKNLDLYFETYVFPSSLPSSYDGEEEGGEEEDDDDDWKMVSIRYPRIQLRPEDRRGLDASLFPNDSTTLQSPAWTSNRERCVRVWEEDVIPCGKPAIRRLAPNRRTRLGFHGDQLFDKNGVPDPYTESRKVFLVLSTSAFYIVTREDATTTSGNNEKQLPNVMNRKKFPSPIEGSAIFKDAPWPHAVARHSYQDLQAISIGNEFQRLTLRFTNPTWRQTDPFVYILMTCNKNNTVSLLQEIQNLAKEANEHVEDLMTDSTAVAIENDSQMVFDALAVSVAPDLVGTVLHYQIVQQRWKHGEKRGTVRRVCVVTDSKLLLLDEDYAADGHQVVRSVWNSPTNGGGLADVSYRIVDEASLQQGIEVQAATGDPRAITILIQPMSRLSRIHRWRLICRDSAGAERLVEDVRKAMALATDDF